MIYERVCFFIPYEDGALFEIFMDLISDSDHIKTYQTSVQNIREEIKKITKRKKDKINAV